MTAIANWKIIIMIIGGLLLMAPEVKAQSGDSATGQSKDPVVAALQKEKAIAELKKEIAEAKRDTLKAQLPPTETKKGASGSVTVGDKAGYFAELRAYSTLRTAAIEIAKVLGDGVDKTIIITDQTDLSQKSQIWRLIKDKLDDFEKRFADLLERVKDIKRPKDFVQKRESLTAAAITVPLILGSLADIVSFFKVDIELKGREITLAKNVLLAETAKALKEKNWNIFLPMLNTTVPGVLLAKLDKLAGKSLETVQRKRDLEKLISPEMEDLALKRKALKAKKDELKKLEKAKPEDQDAIDKARSAIETLDNKILPLASMEATWNALAGDFDALLDGYDAYQKVLTTGDAGKPSPIEALALIDLIQTKSDAERLHLDIASQGAEIHTTKSVWTSGRIHYLGGSVTLYFWLDSQGNYKSSGSLPLWEQESFKAGQGIEALGSPFVSKENK